MKELLETAQILAKEAGGHIRQSASQLRQVDYKGRADMVTDVDRRAEEIILDGIQRKQKVPCHCVGQQVVSQGKSNCRHIVPS